MAPAAFPFAGCDPLLMEEEPLDRPRNDALNDGLARVPFVVARIVDAEGRKVGIVAKAVNVLCKLAGAARITADRRVQHKHSHIGVGEIEARKIPASKVHDSQAIRLTDRAQRPFPNPYPI